MVSSHVLRDAGLALLGVVTAAAAGYVLLRDPLPEERALLPAPVVGVNRPAFPTAVPLPSPTPDGVDVVLLRSAETASSHVLEAGRRLGWTVVDVPLDGPLPSLQGTEVILVQAGQDDQERVIQVVGEARRASSSARLVVVAPLVQVGRSARTRALARATTDAGAQLLDPVALEWVQGRDVFGPSGSLTAQGAGVVGVRLADALA